VAGEYAADDACGAAAIGVVGSGEAAAGVNSGAPAVTAATGVPVSGVSASAGPTAAGA
jgi:hypothetical protein